MVTNGHTNNNNDNNDEGNKSNSNDNPSGANSKTSLFLCRSILGSNNN